MTRRLNDIHGTDQNSTLVNVGIAFPRRGYVLVLLWMETNRESIPFEKFSSVLPPMDVPSKSLLTTKCDGVSDSVDKEDGRNYRFSSHWDFRDTLGGQVISEKRL